MISDQTYEEAAGWLVRQDDDAMDWDGFTAWLEADPRHRTAYDQLALIEAQIGSHASRLVDEGSVAGLAAANDRGPLRWGRWAGFGGGAIAAGVAIALTLQSWTHNLPVQEYRSSAGKTVEIALSDGAQVVLAPTSHLTVQGERITLKGTGYFDVPHQPGRKLTVTAGDFIVTDIGTRFAIENEEGGVNVDVAQGALSVSSGRLAKPVALSAGQGIRALPSSGAIEVVRVDPQQVASWRAGRLQFDQVPLALVANRISRYSGTRITVDASIAKQPFSGVIAINHGEEPARTLAQILSLDAKTVDGATRLEPRRH